MDFAPYAGAIEKVSTLVDGVIRRIFPEKMSELDGAKLKQEVTMALLSREGAEMVKEFEDRADARALAAKDAEKGNWFTSTLSASVRPIGAYIALAAFFVPLAVRLTTTFLNRTFTEAQLAAIGLTAIEKEVVLSIIYFYYGGRVIEKGMAVWKGGTK